MSEQNRQAQPFTSCGSVRTKFSTPPTLLRVFLPRFRREPPRWGSVRGVRIPFCDGGERRNVLVRFYLESCPQEGWGESWRRCRTSNKRCQVFSASFARWVSSLPCLMKKTNTSSPRIHQIRTIDHITFLPFLPRALSAYTYEALLNDSCGSGPLAKHFEGDFANKATTRATSSEGAMELAEAQVPSTKL